MRKVSTLRILCIKLSLTENWVLSAATRTLIFNHYNRLRVYFVTKEDLKLGSQIKDSFFYCFAINKKKLSWRILNFQYFFLFLFQSICNLMIYQWIIKNSYPVWKNFFSRIWKLCTFDLFFCLYFVLEHINSIYYL